jgi:hypothetical protein
MAPRAEKYRFIRPLHGSVLADLPPPGQMRTGPGEGCSARRHDIRQVFARLSRESV